MYNSHDSVFQTKIVTLDTIFFDGERTLFASFKYVGTDIQADMIKMRADPKIREWWAMTDAMQVCDMSNFNKGARKDSNVNDRRASFLEP